MLIGRSEQADAGLGVSSNYACLNCCNDSPVNPKVSPGSIEGVVGGSDLFSASYQLEDCYGGISQDNVPASFTRWSSSNTSVAVVATSEGLATGQSAGSATITAQWSATKGTYVPLEYDEGGGYSSSGWCAYNKITLSASATYTVRPSVGKIQYQSGDTFADIAGTLYVLKGTSVTFKAVPKPPSAAWPAGRPVWSGTSGAAGSGPTVTVAFNTASSSTGDFKTVIASSGNNVLVNIIVYELNGVVTPDNDFAGRSNSRFGILEQMSPGFSASPPVTAAQAGGLRWRIASVGVGNGTLAPVDDGAGVYNAPDTAKTVTLKLEVLNGPSKGGGPTRDLTIVQPVGGFIRRIGGIRHTFNSWSVGFLGEIHVTPSDVSFFNLSFYEDVAPGNASGWLAEFNSPHPRSKLMVRIDSKNVVNELDEIYSGRKFGPCGDGEWLWDIPWRIHTDTGRDFVFAIIRQRATSDVFGKATISKGGTTATRVPSYPTSEW